MAKNSSVDPFFPALEEMRAAGSRVFPPTSFTAYCSAHGLPRLDTWRHLSVDFRSRLADSLRSSKTMVLRLGAAKGIRGTQFALVRGQRGLDDFFLDDEDVFHGVEPVLFEPRVLARELLAFGLLPALTETSLVNLAFASGLVDCSLGLDDGVGRSVPATGQSTFSFDVRPGAGLFDVVWRHERGQVEIDSMFVGRRRGVERLFVVEAKTGGASGDIAKHKMAYSALAVASALPVSGMEVVPVYMKVEVLPDEIVYRVAELEFDDVGKRSISGLRPREGRSRALVLRRALLMKDG